MVKDEFMPFKLSLKTFIDFNAVIEKFNLMKINEPIGLGEYQRIFIELIINMNILKK